jgi:V8-like Glu-specific endopeptidase
MSGSDRDLQKILPGTRISRERSNLERTKPRVCRIDYPKGEALGTGFLVGPNLVLTCFHVADEIKDPRHAVLRFDYNVNYDGILKSKAYTLVDNHWCVATSPLPKDDLKSGSISEPTLQELDYALLLLSSNPAYDQVAGSVDAPVFRGWIDPPGSRSEFRKNTPLHVIQHPIGAPLEWPFDRKGLLSVLSNRSRLRHRVWTLPGSSGSPCFDDAWTWVAMHQGSGPDEKPTYNVAIPSWEIVADLSSKGLNLTRFVDQPWPVVISKPERIDFRGRGDPGEGDWKSDALMITLQPLAVSVGSNAGRDVKLVRSSLSLPQFELGRNFCWGWKVALNEAGLGFLGHIDDVHTCLINPGGVFSHEIMYRPINEQMHISWKAFVDTMGNFVDTKLTIDVKHEFDEGVLELRYEIATAEILSCLSIGFKNVLHFPRFIQPSVL